MKTKKLVLLLPLLPFLMANSPVRSVYSGRYEDFEASYVGEEIIDNYRYQVFHVKNIGEGYISSFNVSGNSYSYEFSANARENEFYPIFDSVVIGPKQEVDIKIKSYNALAVIDGSKLNYYSYAYTAFVEEATVSGSYNVELLKQTESYCYYSIDVKVENVPSKESNAVVFKANYDGNDFYLKVDSYQKYRFYTSEPLDLSKLEIVDKAAVLKDVHEADNYDDGFTIIGQFLLRLLLIFVTIIFIVGSIIFLTIFLPKIIRKSNQRKRDAINKKNNEENKRE